MEKVFGEYEGIEGQNIDEEIVNPTGTPSFWLMVLKNIEEVTPLILKYDKPILKHFRVLRIRILKPDEPLAFTLKFLLEPSNYFTNEVLTKTYTLKTKLLYSQLPFL